MTALADLRWVDVPCALCGSGDRATFAESGRYAVSLSVVRCRSCGHVYLCPRPADEDLRLLYDEAYYKGTGGDGEYLYADDRECAESARIRADARLVRLEGLVEPGRLLEVGCSFGAFLLAARERGWTVTGVDLSPYAAAACEDAGVPVILGTLEGAGVEPASLDAVYLSETVEHLPDPRTTLGAAAAALRPGGILAIGTANLDSLARRLRGSRWGYYMPGHLQYFSAASLGRLMGEVGTPIVRRRFGDDRSLRALRAARRAGGQPCGPLSSLRDLALRARLRGTSLGAGMVLYGRRS